MGVWAATTAGIVRHRTGNTNARMGSSGKRSERLQWYASDGGGARHAERERYWAATADRPPRSTYFWIFPVAVLGSSGRVGIDRKSTRLNSSHIRLSRMPS